MSYQLGVDLGTTFTAAAVHRDGQVGAASLGSRSDAIPSVVLIREDDSVLIGEAAERRATQEPERVAREFKRRVGDTTPLLIGGSPFSAEALTGRLLRWVVDEVTTREGGPPDSTVVCHPANWGPYKIELLDQAIQLAGVSGATRITEPEAAAIHYSRQSRVDTGSVIAVYDLGGGTFDAAVLRKTPGGFAVLGAPKGIERLGGIDFDAAVSGHVGRVLADQMPELDEADPTVVAAFSRLRTECVIAKETLSSDTDVTIPVMLPGLTTEVRLTRHEFEAMIRPSLVDSIGALRLAVESAGLAPTDVSSVLLVGGSSRIPLVAQLVGSELARPVSVDTHPKLTIALGAAVVGTEPPESQLPRPPGGVAPPPTRSASVTEAGTATVAGAAAAVSGAGTAGADDEAAAGSGAATGIGSAAAAGGAAMAAGAGGSAMAAGAGLGGNLPDPPGGPPGSGPPGPPPGTPPPGGGSRSRLAWLIGIPILVVVALLAATFGFIVGGGEAGASEVLLEPITSVGQDPFTPTITPEPADPVSDPVSADVVADLNPPIGETSAIDFSGVEVPTAADGEIINISGSAPGLYGGTNVIDVCDRAQLVDFLTTDTEKGRAWAEVHGIEVDQIAPFIAGLTDVILPVDTRVTNHGFRDGSAYPIDSVLQAGTAVLVDAFGVPRVRCYCGNPLLPARFLVDEPEVKGTEWEGFDLDQAVVITAAPEPVDEFVVDDIGGTDLLTREPGSAPETAVVIQPTSTSTSTTTTTPTTTSTTSSTTTTTTRPPPVDITAAGGVNASSVFGGSQFPARLSIDGDNSTSWFSAGGGTATYTWDLDGDAAFIDFVTIVGNAGHSVPDFRTDFGFEGVTVAVLNGNDEVYSETFGLGGTPDPDITAFPGVVGSRIVLSFTGGESDDCGGFAELIVAGSF